MGRYLFRADASIDIGTGHVMRCMTLAKYLMSRGHDVLFIMRELTGHLGTTLQSNHIPFYLLSTPAHITAANEPMFTHSSWLTVNQTTDISQSLPIIMRWRPHWIIVDHYALAETWEIPARECGAEIAVIDDLADRKHDADVLIDTNLGHTRHDYQHLVPHRCNLLMGPKYAILRPEFIDARSDSLNRRKNITEIKNILINLGGVDKENKTELILDILNQMSLPEHIKLTVVMGKTAPFLKNIQQKAQHMSHHTEVLSDTHHMAKLMTDADVAIGAAGSTSWERCCLGLPTILLTLAENQKHVADFLAQTHAVFAMPYGNHQSNFYDTFTHTMTMILKHPERLTLCAQHAQQLVDGKGTSRIATYMVS